MATPQFIEEHAIALTDVSDIFNQVEKRDTSLNTRSLKVKEFCETFQSPLGIKKKQELVKKLQDLGLTRIREEHIVKIIDFLPKDSNELKVVLQAYPLSLSKKDQDSIIGVVKDYL